MAIRLTDDNNFSPNPSSGNGGNNNRNNNNSNGIMALIAMLFKKSPLLAIVVGLGFLAYTFFLGGGGDGTTMMDDNEDNGLSYATGCSMDPAIYDKAFAFEPLEMVTGNNRMPSSASLAQYIPNRRNQGQQGSCVGWASAYAAHTIIEAKATGKNPNTTVFSPAFLYNQIKINNRCEGAYLINALKVMKEIGSMPLAEFPYDERSCMREPAAGDKQKAASYNNQITAYTRLTMSGFNQAVNIDAIKQNLANGGPVVIGMMVPPSFERLRTELWTPTAAETSNPKRYGGHAMCIIGFDDNKYGGAFHIMNSWGEDWGKDGLFWVKYNDFKTFTMEAYGIAAPMQYVKEEESLPEDYMKIQMGLWLRKGNNGEYMSLKKTGVNQFENSVALRKGDSFKVGVDNGTVAYIYIFGAEATGESYQLFPYEKTSPFFNIKGARLFPKDKSFTVDEVGNKDYMAIVVSKTELNPADINNKINNSRKATYAERVTEAMGNMIAPNPNWTISNNGVKFDGRTGNKDAMLMVFGIHKN